MEFAEEVDFGTRHCHVCGNEVGAIAFGIHVVSHGEDGMQRWPGGLKGVQRSLLESVEESIRRARAVDAEQTVRRLERTHAAMRQVFRVAVD